MRLPPPPRRATGPAGHSPSPEAADSGTVTDGLQRLNSLSTPEAERMLLRCCAGPRWAERLAAHRPYPDTEALLAAADEASYDLTADELAEALTEEPALHPLTDQPGALAAHTALRAAHAAYESRFGHAFVICADDYRGDELLDQTLAAIRLRLGNEPDEERAVTAEELRRIARGRLARETGRDPAWGPSTAPGNTGPSVPD